MARPAAVEAILFDVGNVLVEWDPRHLYRKIFCGADGTADEARIERFLAEICTTAWHERHDLGRSPAEQVAERAALHPAYAAEIAAFYDRFQEMIPGAIAGSVALKRRLKARGLPIYGLTNFGVETYAETRRRFDFLREFDGVVVSGEERIKKPDPAIFAIVVERFAVHPATTLFVDDSARNIATASTLGFQTHQFRGTEGLAAALGALGLD